MSVNVLWVLLATFLDVHLHATFFDIVLNTHNIANNLHRNHFQQKEKKENRDPFPVCQLNLKA